MEYTGFPSLPPSYATIVPQTKCIASKAWGEWTLSSTAQISDQVSCVIERPLKPMTTTIEKPTIPERSTFALSDFNVTDEAAEMNISNEKECIKNALVDFHNLGMFCRVKTPTGQNALNTSFLMQGCEQKKTSIELLCETENKTLELNDISLSNLTTGLYFCGSNGKIMPSPCPFDPIQFMKKQHDNSFNGCDYLPPSEKEQCRSVGGWMNTQDWNTDLSTNALLTHELHLGFRGSQIHYV